MKLRPTEKIEGFISYIDERGLTDKAQRVRNLWEFINNINKDTKPLLDKLNVILFTDPATIIADEYFNNLEQIMDITFKIWEEVKFPIQDSLFIRTSSFLNVPNCNFPMTELSLSKSKDEILKGLKVFIKQNKPEQMIFHPRIDNERAKKDLIAFRPKSIAGDIYCEFATGGIYHLRNMETADKYQEFALNNIKIKDIDSRFLPYTKAFKVISGFADTYIKKYLKKLDSSNTPVYEIKCFTINGKYYMNLFDYELI